MGPFSFAEAEIRERANAQSYRRGADYAEQKAVVSLIRRGDTLQAEVEGSGPEPYRVAVSFAEGKFSSATCDCDYEYDGWCKHIVAALLTALRRPGEVEERTPVPELLAGRSVDELRDLLVSLAEKRPEIADDIEKWTRRNQRSRPATAAAPTVPDAATLDPKAYQKRMKAIFRNVQTQVENYHSEDDPLEIYAEQASELIEEAQGFLDRGEARNAAVILAAISDSTTDELDELADYSYGEDDIFRELGEMWIEILLVGKWTASEKAGWTKRLNGWHEAFEDWGAGQTLKAAVTALEQGWDFPPLVAILSGAGSDWAALAGRETTEEDAEDEEEQDEEDEYNEAFAEEDGETEDAALALARIRTVILHREGRSEEAANLARAAGLHEQYAELLVMMARFSEAARYAKDNLPTSAQLLKIALLLADKGARAEAIAVGAHGLDAEKRLLDGEAYVNARLAEWLLDYARENGEPEIALKAGRGLIEAAPSLAAWKKVAALAGNDWDELRKELLADLLTGEGYDSSGRADIFLQEGLYAEAVALARRSHNYDLMARVADAALPHVPQDIIELSRERAESIMDRGKSEYYSEAARWLRRAKTAYLNLHADSEWQTCLLEVKSKHGRKYTLMPLIKDL